MDLSQKVDVLDLIIQTLREHEEKLSELADRIESLLKKEEKRRVQ